MGHDDLGAVLYQHISDLFRLRWVVVAASIGDGRNAGANSREGSGFGVLYGDALFGLDANLLTGPEVDGWVRLCSGLGERGSGREDVTLGEVLVLVDLLNGSNHTAESGGRYDGHSVFALLLDPFKFLGGPDAGLGFLLEGSDDTVFLHLDVSLTFVVAEREVVLGL